MKELKERLIQLEEEFNHFKNKIERHHFIFIVIIFGIPTAVILVMDKFFSIYFNLPIKLLLFSIILIGLVFHFFLRNKFYKKNYGYKNFFNKNISKLKKEFSLDNAYKEKIINAGSEILKNRGISLTEEKMDNYPFWQLLIKNLKEKSELDKL